MSFRLKTIIGIAIIEALLLLLLVSITLGYLRTTNYEALIKRASTTATLFATTTKDAVLSYDLASLDSFVKVVLKNPDLVYARVLGPDDGVFAEAGDPHFLQLPFVADKSVELASDGVFDTYAEIKEAGVTYGRVEIGLDISSIRITIAEAENRSAIIAVVEMALVALFSFLLGAYLTRQLKVLSIAAESISAGNLDIKLPVSGRDEIANVAVAFNAMASSLSEVSARRDQFETELRELNTSLEQRVEQRTQQMRLKNRQLEQANSEIKAAQTRLLQAEKMASLGVLAAGVAHEINNPISFVMSNLHTLEIYGSNYRQLIAAYNEYLDETEPEASKRYQEKLERLKQECDLEFMNDDLDSLLSDSIEGTERVRDIVRGLKSFSHIETVTNFEMYDLNGCIESALKVAMNELKYHCEINKELTDLPLTYCCPGQIEQVVLNLLLNAGQAIEGKGVITIRSERVDEQLEISIADTGNGISKEQKNKLFDPFFTTKAVGEGAGLGLAIVYGIAQEHKGEVRVESSPGQGSCFTLSIPLALAPQAVIN